MKKLLSAIFICALVLGLSMAAYGEAQPPATPDATSGDDVDEWLFEEDEDWNWDDEDIEDGFFDDIESDDGEFLDEEDTVEDTLLSAMEVYSWFVLQPLDVDPDKPDQTGELFQVLDDRYNTMDVLRAFVSTYFSDEIVNELFAMDVYKEIDGYLYTTVEGRNIDENIGETEFFVSEETESRIVYTVSVNYWESDESIREETFTYVREKFGDDWKFTTFPFFW